MTERPTPETDAEETLTTKGKPRKWVSKDFARRLERERDELREAVLEYLSFGSCDGNPKRGPLREKLRALANTAPKGADSTENR